MTKTLISLSIAALLGSVAYNAAASTLPGFEASIARAERVEKPQKPEKRGALESAIQVAREATEAPRGGDNERPGDRQRRGKHGEAPEQLVALDATFLPAREAAEAPRGANNERPGDRQNRGGRKA